MAKVTIVIKDRADDRAGRSDIDVDWDPPLDTELNPELTSAQAIGFDFLKWLKGTGTVLETTTKTRPKRH